MGGIIPCMARGWESKSVEEQQSESISVSETPKPQLTPAEMLLRQKRDGLLLNRKRVFQQLQTAANPHHREMLEKAIADLDTQLSKLV